ncbi:MAG: sigma-70 family RNA polymerase sigma factor [Prevotella sp.]|nr:sigma-70 family RNA polymerase sigma factor [Prevotella sp.]MDO5524966.1 sigma-70 family RNA polymerase sigma factor [Prevotella sp.]
MTNFSEIYDKHVDNLFAYGCKITPDRELVKDCIQDVFVKLFAKRDELAGISNIGSYLIISLRNRINDEYRRTSRIVGDDASSVGYAAVEEDNVSLEAIEEEQNIHSSLMKSIARLSPRQQQIIHLYYMEQRKYDDICDIMGINYQSVRNLMHRSISNLRKFVAV